MPTRLKQLTRTIRSKFRPVEHVPSIVHNNVHDLSRVGGVSVLSLPNEYTPCDLVVPTRFAATAQFLVDAALTEARQEQREKASYKALRAERREHRESMGNLYDGYESEESEEKVVGKINMPGLFRIPGSKVTTERLRNYFERQLYDGGGTVEDVRRRSTEIEYTVRLPLLPNSNVIPYQLHDVASCFKSFLADLNGGILGSLDIFNGLRKVVLPQKLRKSTDSSDLEWKCRGAEVHEPVNPDHVARILCSIECAASRNLIMAVFGLLAYFMMDDSREPMHPSTYTKRTIHAVPGLDELRDNCLPASRDDGRMTAEALGRIFAPLMLSEDDVKRIKMDARERSPKRKDVKDRERKRQSWTPSKRGSANGNTPSPNKRVVAKLSTRSSLTRSNVNVSINLVQHPHPLRSSPYLPLHEAAQSSDYDVSNRRSAEERSPLSSNRTSPIRQSRNLGMHPELNDSAYSFVKAHANCSAPNLTNLTNLKHTESKSKSNLISTNKEKESKSTALLHDQQARILLIADVITITLLNWKNVCKQLRAYGYGQGERWYVGYDEADHMQKLGRRFGPLPPGEGINFVDV